MMRHDADRARMGRRSTLESQHDIEEQPVAIEEGIASVDQMLQHCEDMGEGSRLANEMGDASLCQLHQILILIACIEHQ